MSLLLFFSGVDVTKGISASINSMGEQFWNVTINSIGEQFWNVVPVGLGLDLLRLVRLDLSPGLYGFQEMLQSLLVGDPFTSKQVLLGSLVVDTRRIQAILNVLSSSVQEIHSVENVLSGDGAVSVQKLINEIMESDTVRGQQRLLQSIGETRVSCVPVTNFDIYIDGISVKNKVSAVSILYDETSVHNSIDVQFMHGSAFWKCNPETLEGTARIEVVIGGRHIWFLLEKRKGNEHAFSIWGRSLSAMDDFPYADEIDYFLLEPKSAKDIAEEVLSECSLDWECDNWILPTEFEFKGSPVGGVMSLAAIIGAVVRSKDDGTILVRQKLPVRPVNINGSPITINYDRAALIEIEYSNEIGNRYNAVEIYGRSDSIELPDIIVEEELPNVGDEVNIRVYWLKDKPSGIIDLYVTDGIITEAGDNISTEIETVVFKSGVASVSKPILSVMSVSWIGDSGGVVSNVKYSKDIGIENSAYRIAKITYTSSYSRYRLSQHDVELLLALLSFGGEFDVAVNLKIESGDNPAPTINNAFLTSQSIAVTAGTAWLDATRYDNKQVVVGAPYGNVKDGELVYINDAEINCVGNFHVESCNIIISPAKIVNRLKVVQWKV